MLKRGLLVAAVAAGAVLMVGCEPFLVYQEQFPEFKPKSDKALCVVIRPTGGIGALRTEATLWLDGKVVSGTGPNTITSFDVEPGEHILVTQLNTSGMIKPKARVKFNYQPGKVYFVLQPVYPIGIGVASSLVPMPGDEAMAKIEEERGKCQYVYMNSAYEDAEDMDENDVQDEYEEWASWAEEEPEDAKKETDYPGY